MIPAGAKTANSTFSDSPITVVARCGGGGVGGTSVGDSLSISTVDGIVRTDTFSRARRQTHNAAPLRGTAKK